MILNIANTQCLHYYFHSLLFIECPVSVQCSVMMITQRVIYLGGRIHFHSFINDFSQEFIESLNGRRGSLSVSSVSLAFYGTFVLIKGLWIGCWQTRQVGPL